MTYRYPKGPDDPEASDFEKQRFSTAHRVAGTGDPSALFGESPVTPTPWPRAGRMKNRAPFDQNRVNEALSNPQFRDVDPAQLHSTQPNVTRAGVEYYMGDEYERTGTTYADMDQPGNRYPMVYNREGVNMLLGGHHRATAALLSGKQFRANYVEGGWGAEKR